VRTIEDFLKYKGIIFFVLSTEKKNNIPFKKDWVYYKPKKKKEKKTIP
jgi:hypothetical protein